MARSTAASMRASIPEVVDDGPPSNGRIDVGNGDGREVGGIVTRRRPMSRSVMHG